MDALSQLIDFEITDFEIEKQEAIIEHMGKMIEENQKKIDNGQDIPGCQRMIERLEIEISNDRKKLDGDPNGDTAEKRKGWKRLLAEAKLENRPAIIKVIDGMPL